MTIKKLGVQDEYIASFKNNIRSKSMDVADGSFKFEGLSSGFYNYSEFEYLNMSMYFCILLSLYITINLAIRFYCHKECLICVILTLRRHPFNHI